MRSLLLFSLVTTLVSCPLLAAEPAPAPEPKPVGVKSLPANQWAELPLSGWKGKTWYGPGIHFGFCGAGSLGVVVLDGATLNKDAHIQDVSTARVRKLDSATGAWTEHAAAALEVGFKDIYNAGILEHLHGTQLCYDPDRKVLVGLTATNLDGRGRTVEFDLEAKKASGHKPDPSPPVVTAASLCYDPVNKEVLLATGGFSPVGGTEGTWLYDGAKKQWRRLETPKEMDEVRLPLQQARDRLITLRWLVWKNLEFRATGREKLLEERSKGEALAKETAELAAEFKRLGELAGTNSAKAERPYHKSCLAAAGKLLGEAAGKLNGGDAKLKAGSPEELEGLYRASVVPALETVEKAVSELAVAPEPRMSARLACDPKNKLIVCFGGDGQRCAWGDTWVYHCEGRWWERRHPAAHPSPRNSRAMAHDAKNGVTVLVESVQWGQQNDPATWVYEAAGDQWKRLDIPTSKEIFWLEYDANAGCLVAFNHDMNKAWVLRLDPAGAKPGEAKEAPEVAWAAATGEHVLRDAATVAELKKYKAEMDDWVKGVAANTWVAVPTRGTGRPNWGRTWSSIVYDPDRLQIYYRDGGHGSYHGADTDHYDLPTGRWFRSDGRDVPPWPMGSYFGWGRSFSYAPWAVHSYKYGLFLNPLRSRLQRAIGQSGRMENAGPGSVLEYDPDTGRWAREFQPLGAGAGGAFGGGVTVPGVPGGMLSIDNFSRYGQKDGEATLLTKDGPRQLKGLGTLPRAHDDHCFCWFFDPKRKRAMYYGGPKDKHELFALDVAAEAPKWQKLEVKGADGKLPMSSREVVYVPKHDVFLMLAAAENPYAKGIFEEVWSLDPQKNVFARLPLAGGAPAYGGVSNGLQYDPVTDLCFYIAAGSGAPPMFAFRYAPEKK